MKKIIPAIAVVAILAVSQNASAREFADIYTECGLGAMIAPHNAPVAVITNVTWDLGTTAVSSDASSQETCQGGQAKTAAFIYKTYPQLEQDLARGEGEHLNALMAMAGCDAAASSALSQALRADLANSASDASYAGQSAYEKAEKLHQELYRHIDSGFAMSCNVG